MRREKGTFYFAVGCFFTYPFIHLWRTIIQARLATFL